MALKSVYLPDPSIDGDLIRISGDEHHHLAVGRAVVNEAFEIFDGKGGVWSAVITTVGRRETSARITGRRVVDPGAHDVILGQALIRAAAFELALEKAVEIGVTRIVPFVASRSNVAAGKRTERWNRLIVEAAKQSKHYRFPVLDEVASFEQVLRTEARSRIVLAERGGGPLKPAIKGSPVLYLVGPEGGWTDEELKTVCQNGFTLVSLGGAILKSETAAIVGGALIRYELGC